MLAKLVVEGKEFDIEILDPGLQKLIAADRNKVCGCCKKNDVCLYRSELENAIVDIAKISDRTNVFIETGIACKYWM